MIEINGVSKSFRDTEALRNLTLTIRDGEVFGLIGTNGAGKSTLLRILSGVLKQDCGEVLVDGQPVYENTEIKRKICFLSDTVFEIKNATPEDMEQEYSLFYPGFNRERYYDMLGKIGIDPKKKLRTFSKGMKRQVAVLLGICTGAKYLFCDELFDGLDPVMRQAVKSLFAQEMIDNGLTPVIASHNLRELEDICDHVGLLHRGGVLLSEDLSGLKLHMCKLQCLLKDDEKEKQLLEGLNVLKMDRSGSMLMIVARGEAEQIMEKVQAVKPIFVETLPLTLEEIFITETGVSGYDFNDLFI
uniref:ABC transporter ATP-binding protein n=1 Tax=Eubacterium cellulosolvens TaxID=29322 RepID=UPI00047FDA66|nr:ABC transporter ATP-binding protein [[Eubacterium] cellulosolvens]